MKRYNRTQRYANRIQTKLSLQSNLSALLIGVFLSLLFIGCGKIFMREGKYVTPELPKSELATIQIDTEGQWLQRAHLFVLRINGKIAVRKEFGDNKKSTIDEILVVPGKHDMSMLVIMESHSEGIPQNRQSISDFYTEVKAGGTYLLNGKYTYNTEEGFSFKLIDTDTDKVVSKSKIFGKSTFGVQKPGSI